MQPQRVRNLNPQELNQVINLHLKVIQESTLNKLGRKFLGIVYKEFLKNQRNVFLTITDNKEIIGFAAATDDIRKLYKDIIHNNFLNLALEVVKSSISHPKLVLQVMGWLLGHKQPNSYPAELHFIGVSENYQGQGLGTSLMKKLGQEFKSVSIRQYRVGTWASNERSNQFYMKLGFKLLYSEMNLGERFNYYLSPAI